MYFFYAFKYDCIIAIVRFQNNTSFNAARIELKILETLKQYL